ncbi:hypothetical protein BLNAU_17922 [Blattamonas nauphoetae]|uniref:Thioredoxin domain-containing protein n=1 Tax=Blattamonas nauphoetae TaxID=2049346 RepID=A0ABQ9X5V4_9EUKA|nr:hypothetical protein BLNAU_17922 [Blattamonas nauphoetae]
MFTFLPLVAFLTAAKNQTHTISLTTQTFNKQVSGKDDTFFILFYTDDTPQLTELKEQMEKLAKNMKTIGIKVATVHLNENQELAQTYQITQVPHMLFFRPNKEPMKYATDWNAKSIEKWILENMLGTDKVTVLKKEEAVTKYFGETSKYPRVLVFSKKKTPPPMFKQLCYKHRKGINCGFVSGGFNTLPEIGEHISKYGDFSVEDVDYPTVVIIDEAHDPKLVTLSDRLTYETLNATVAPHSLTTKKALAKKEQKKIENLNSTNPYKRLRRENRAPRKSSFEDDDDEL